MESNYRRTTRFALLLLLMIHQVPLTAQLVNTDSLRAVWQDASQPDSVRYSACYDLCDALAYDHADSSLRYATALVEFTHRSKMARANRSAMTLRANAFYHLGLNDSALAMYDRVLQTSTLANDTAQAAAALGNRGSLYMGMGRADDGLRDLERAYVLMTESGRPEHAASIMSNMAVINEMMGRNIKAAECYDRAVREFDALKDEHAAARVMSNLGMIYTRFGDVGKAEAIFRKSITRLKAAGDDAWRSTALTNLGSLLYDEGRKDEAKRTWEEALGLMDEQEGTSTYGQLLVNLGVLEKEAGRMDAAMRLFERALLMSTEKHDDQQRAVASHAMAEWWVLKGEHRKAITVGEEALGLARSSSDLELTDKLLELLQQEYGQVGAYEKAHRSAADLLILRDTTRTADEQRELLRFEYQYENDKRALADSLRHQQEQFANTLAHADQLGRERNQRNMLVAGLALALLLALGIWARMRYMAKADRAIVAAQAQLIESERQLESEKVRTRIASDIHDDLGSDLTKLGLLGREIKRAAAEQPFSTPALADRIVNLSTDAAAALSHIVWAADPGQDSAQGLVGRASVFTKQLLEGTGIEHELEFAHHGEDRVLDPGVKHDVFMLLKELVNNALKHAQAQRIDASLVTDVHGFRLSVRDEGKGYDADGARKGNGLRSVTARSNRIGARATTTTSPGKGCNVRMEGAWERPVASAQGS